MIKNIIAFSILGLIFCQCSLYAQTPVISNLDKTKAYVYDTLTISGNHFGTDVNDILITFGAAQGQVVDVKNNLIKVVVPAGATYGPVELTRLSQSFSTRSNAFLLPSFRGNTFASNLFENITDLATEEDELYDLCTCDFDGDGDNDIGTTNNAESASNTSVTVYSNQTLSPDQLSFQKVVGSNLNINSPAHNITCGDLDADGKPELIVSQGGGAAGQIFIFHNISTNSPDVIKFEDALTVNLTDGMTTHGTRRLAIRDLNGDGLSEIVVTNQNDNQIFILVNKSSDTQIIFNQSDIHTVEVPTNTLGLAIADLNKDFLPEILIANKLGSGLFILQNQSTPGTMLFDEPLTYDIPGPLINIATGDIDGDLSIDVVLTNLEKNSISVLINKSVTQEILLDAPLELIVGQQPWGLDLGDIDGNGKPDIAIATLSVADSLVILTNHSVPGNLNFTQFKVGGQFSSRNLKIADFNGDAKSDLAFTKKNNAGNFFLSAIRNATCLQAHISPVDPDAICESRPITLYATQGAQVTYQWKKNGADIPGATQSSLQVTEAGQYIVSIASSADGCLTNSEEVTVTEDSGTIPENPTINGPSTACEGETVTFTGSSPSGGTYRWYGPRGFSSEGSNLVLSEVTPEQAGEYFLQVTQGACKSALASAILEVRAAQEVKIQLTGGAWICEGESVTLSTNYSGAISYQWKKNDAPIAGATNNTFVASTPGDYTISIETAQGCHKESHPVVVTDTNIQADFQVADSVCMEEDILFVNQTTSEENLSISYFWDFGDGNTSTQENPRYAYRASGTYQVSLQAMTSNTTCVSEMLKEIKVVSSPQMTILPGNDLVLCTGDTLAVHIEGEYSSISWLDGSTGDTFLVTEPGNYTVITQNELGCYWVSEIQVEEQTYPTIEVSAEKEVISQGSSVMLSASGADWYEWSPADYLDDPLSAHPIATPDQTITYTVTGYKAGGCSSTGEVTIQVDPVSMEVEPHTIFSPNEDGIDDYWVIENIESFPECGFMVFNLQGNIVYQSQTNYSNDWNGTDSRGMPLAAGVYYFVIRCGNEENRNSGSITLVR